MNLHAIVGPIIAAVNPMLTVSVAVSIGSAEQATFKRKAAYATPGNFTGSIGGTFTASAAGTTLTVTAVLTGSLQGGDQLSGTDGSGNTLPPGTTIASQLSGTPGGVGTYQLAGGSSFALGSCTVTSVSTVLNVSAVATGILQPGQTLAGAGILTGTMIASQASQALGAAPGGPGVYQVTQAQTVPSSTITTSLQLVAQVQPLTWRDLQQLEGLNMSGLSKAIYINGDFNSIVRFELKGGDVVTLPDGSVWLVRQQLEGFALTAGWTKAAMTLQNGA